ncbi:MAG: expansin EXLX1 family cellulose-binding protein [Cyanobacteria bacterium P01_F01_bin.143]
MNNRIRYRFISRSWEDGFTGTLRVINRGDIVDSWQTVFESEFAINQHNGDYEILGAEVLSEEALANGNYRYVVEPLDYNRTLDNRESVYISFNSAWDQEETPEINNVIFTVPEIEPETSLNADFNFTLVNDWGSGFQGSISITNNTVSNIDTWNLEFDFPNQITNLWDAAIAVQDDGSYAIGNVPWNREISAGETITFGFIGNSSVTVEPQNFALTGSLFDSPSIHENLYTSSNPNLDPELELKNYQGRATFYDILEFNNGRGNSGYDVPAADQRHKITAINSVQWNGSEASGAFFEVSGPKQRDGEALPIIVQVVDQLPERADGFDLSVEAFDKVADYSDGVVNIDYKLVGPPDDYLTAYGYRIDQGIVVEGIAGTNPYYAAVRLNNHRYPIESIDLITDGGNAIALDRQSDNKFVLDGNYPLYGTQDLLVTDIFGQQVTLDDVNITNGSSADIITGEQFDII